MTDDPLYSSATSAMLLAMTAIQCSAGVSAQVALGRSHDLWRDHVAGRSDSWAYSELVALVQQLSAPD